MPRRRLATAIRQLRPHRRGAHGKAQSASGGPATPPSSPGGLRRMRSRSPSQRTQSLGTSCWHQTAARRSAARAWPRLGDECTRRAQPTRRTSALRKQRLRPVRSAVRPSCRYSASARRTLGLSCEPPIRSTLVSFNPLLHRPHIHLGTSSSLIPRPAAMSALAFTMRRRNSGWCSSR
jgi:hypothetical protein